MGWCQVKGDWIGVKQQKTKALLAIPLHEDLRAAIDPLPHDAPAFLKTEQAKPKPFTPAGFGNWMRDRCDETGSPDCSSHELRSAMACRLAKAGCSDKEVTAITGQTILAQVVL
jgi:integrase